MTISVLVISSPPDRLRGYVRSLMLEIRAGVFVSTRLSKRARELLWSEVEPFCFEGDTYAVLVYESAQSADRLSVLTAGTPAKELHSVDGLLLAKHRLIATES